MSDVGDLSSGIRNAILGLELFGNALAKSGVQMSSFFAGFPPGGIVPMLGPDPVGTQEYTVAIDPARERTYSMPMQTTSGLRITQRNDNPMQYEIMVTQQSGSFVLLDLSGEQFIEKLVDYVLLMQFLASKSDGAQAAEIITQGNDLLRIIMASKVKQMPVVPGETVAINVPVKTRRTEVVSDERRIELEG